MKRKAILTQIVVLSLIGGVSYANMTFNIDDKIDKMKADLSLTDEQVKAVKPILEDYKTRMEEISREKEQKLSQVLSPEQLDKMKNMKQDRMEKKAY